MAESNTISIREIKRLMLISYRKYKNGMIDGVQAYRENTMLANIIRAIESSEQEERIQALEKTLYLTKEE